MVLSPTPAHLKATRRPTDGGRTTSRDMSNAGIPPASRRQSQQQMNGGSTVGTAMNGGSVGPAAGMNTPVQDGSRRQESARHPYATAPASPLPNTYMQSADGVRESFNGNPNGNPNVNGRTSNMANPQGNMNANANMGMGRDGYGGYGSQAGAPPQNGMNGMAGPGAPGANRMNMYDGGMERGPGGDDGHGRKKGFFASLCCGA
jgi:casein kinase 1